MPTGRQPAGIAGTSRRFSSAQPQEYRPAAPGRITLFASFAAGCRRYQVLLVVESEAPFALPGERAPLVLMPCRRLMPEGFAGASASHDARRRRPWYVIAVAKVLSLLARALPSSAPAWSCRGYRQARSGCLPRLPARPAFSPQRSAIFPIFRYSAYAI